MRLPRLVLDGGGLAARVGRHARGKDLVTFDVFDTLLLRRCHPGVVADAMVARMAERAGISPDAARRTRDRALATTCSGTVTHGGDHECAIVPWYRAWARLATEGAPDADALGDDLVSEEVALESAVCSLDPRALAAVRAAKRAGCRVLAVSDMYLSAGHIATLLGPAAAEIDGIHTSGDHGLLKRTGRLFRLVREREGVAPGRHLHVGDDLLADAVRPALQGSATLLLRDGRQTRARIGRNARRGIWAADARALARDAIDYALSEPADLDPAEAVGLETFGPILAPFIHAVAERATAEGVDRVFFLAREGLVLKAAYDTIAGEGAPPSAYLCVSRYTSLLAQMRTFGPVEREVMAANMAVPTPRRLLEVLEIEPGTLDRLCALHGLNPDAPTDPEDPGMQALCADPEVGERAASAGAAMRDGLLAHLSSTGFLGSSRPAVVDVGWGGQIQENLSSLGRTIPGFPETRGYYFGLNERAVRRIDSGLRMAGLVTERWSAGWVDAAIFDFVMALEAATRAPHGTTVGYDAAGEPRFAGMDIPGRREEAADDPVLCGLQRGALRFARRYGAFARWTGMPSSAALPLSRAVTARLVRFPHGRERDLFRGLVNVSNLGSSEVIPYIPGDFTWLRPVDALRRARWSLWQEGALGTLLGYPGQAAFSAAKAYLQPFAPPRPPSIRPGPEAPLPLPSIVSARPDDLHARLWLQVEAMPPCGPRTRFEARLRPGRPAVAVGWLSHALGALLARRRPMRRGTAADPAPGPGPRLLLRAWADGLLEGSLAGQGSRIALRVIGFKGR